MNCNCGQIDKEINQGITLLPCYHPDAIIVWTTDLSPLPALALGSNVVNLNSFKSRIELKVMKVRFS